MGGYSVETNYKINNISGNIDALLMKVGTSTKP